MLGVPQALFAARADVAPIALRSDLCTLRATVLQQNHKYLIFADVGVCVAVAVFVFVLQCCVRVLYVHVL